MKAIRTHVLNASSFEEVTYRCSFCGTETPRVMQPAARTRSGNIHGEYEKRELSAVQ